MKKALGIMTLVGIVFGLYQLVGNGDSSDREEVASEKVSRWQSAKKSADHSKHGHDDDKAKVVQDSSKEKRSKEGSKEIENPFLSDTTNDVLPSWEEAKKFAFRPLKFQPRDEQEEALLEMNRYMAAAFMVPDSHEKLLEMYREKGLSPDLSQSSNPHTGKMITIRTQNSLPGVRYPHSQLFSNDRNEMEMQHTSVEYRPGPQAFERVNEMVKELYQVKDGVSSQDGRFIKYKLGKDQILWVQKMAPKDLKDSPFNAYEETDVGTIRMAIEQEIHFEEEGADPHISPDKHNH